jgi:hypothetical protein
VEPSGQLFGARDITGPARQNQERGLVRVLRVLLVAEHAPAHPHHHRAVPAHQFGERRTVPRLTKAVQEFGVPQFAHLERTGQTEQGTGAVHGRSIRGTLTGRCNGPPGNRAGALEASGSGNTGPWQQY